MRTGISNAWGYVRIYRSLLDWEWYDDDVCVRLMLHLILSANWEVKEWHGQLIQPGQLVTSMEGMAGKLRLSRSAVRRALDKLKGTGEVTVQTNNHWTTITLTGWAEFQEAQPTNGRQKSRPPTDHRPTTDRPPATTEEGNQERREEERESGARKVLFVNSRYCDLPTVIAALPELVEKGADIEAYRNSIRNWSDQKDERRTDRGWLATFRDWFSRDEKKGVAVMKVNKAPRATGWLEAKP